jgi:hypothetical protein
MAQTAIRLGIKEWGAAQASPTHLFLVGLLVLPAFLFQSSLPLKWVQILLFMGLSAAAGKRVRLLPNLIMITGIVAANLLTPVGRVLWSAAGIRITLGALENGLDRAALLIGMIYISRFSIRKGFCLPGRFGELLSLVFFYLERILEGERLSRGNLIEKIDQRIISVHESASEYIHRRETQGAPATSPTGILYLASVLAIQWGLFAYPHIHRLL